MIDHLSPKTLRWLLFLVALEGVFAMAWLLYLPGEAGGRTSPGRLALLAPGLLIIVLSAWTALQPSRAVRLGESLHRLTHRERVYTALLICASLIALLCIVLLLITWRNTDPYVGGYLSRLAPYALWGTLLSIQFALSLRWLRYGSDLGALDSQRKAWGASAIAFVLLLLLVAFIYITKLGLAPDQAAWGDPGVPIFGWQVLLALGTTWLGWLSWKEWLSRLSWLRELVLRKADLLICLLLWGAAVWRWGIEPLRPSYFSPEPVPPTQEFFPYSDAANYDLAAHSLLSGYGLGGDVVRPFYSFFLALAHSISGPGYQGALTWQIPLLALLPPVLYLIASRLYTRTSGIFVGLLAILQNSNAIALASAANVSHAKLLMSDLPTALGIAAVTALLLWLEHPDKRQATLLAAGGVLGITMLVRVQALALLPVALLAVWLSAHPGTRPGRDSLILLAGFGCVLLPWLWRNARTSEAGIFSEASQASQIGLIGQRYNLVIDMEAGKRLPGESDGVYSRRMLGSAASFVRQHPSETARFVTAHFLHNQVATFLVLPLSYPGVDFLVEMVDGWMLGLGLNSPAVWGRCCAPASHIRQLTYWNNWDGEPDIASYPLMLLGLLATAAGIAAAWQRRWLAAALPLAVSLVYSLSNALVRNSGWRFNQPVDWIGYLFYGIGILHIGGWAVAYFAPSMEASLRPRAHAAPPQPRRSKEVWTKTLLAGVAFLLLSAAIPVSEGMLPQRFRDVQVSAVLDEVEEQGLLAPFSLDAQGLMDFLAQDGAEALVGGALYPRYFQAGDGEPGSGWPSFTSRPYERLGFYLVGPSPRHVVLRTPLAPASFPHAADVLVLGCAAEGYLDASLVIRLDPQKSILVRTPLDGWSCPGEGE